MAGLDRHLHCLTFADPEVVHGTPTSSRSGKRVTSTPRMTPKTPPTPFGFSNSPDVKDAMDWLNATLGTQFTFLDSLRNGSVFLRLADFVFPGCVNMSRAYIPEDDEDLVDWQCFSNLKLLQFALVKRGAKFDIDLIMSRNQKEIYEPLKWLYAAWRATHPAAVKQRLEHQHQHQQYLGDLNSPTSELLSPTKSSARTMRTPRSATPTRPKRSNQSSSGRKSRSPTAGRNMSLRFDNRVGFDSNGNEIDDGDNDYRVPGEDSPVLILASPDGRHSAAADAIGGTGLRAFAAFTNALEAHELISGPKARGLSSTSAEAVADGLWKSKKILDESHRVLETIAHQQNELKLQTSTHFNNVSTLCEQMHNPQSPTSRFGQASKRVEANPDATYREVQNELRELRRVIIASQRTSDSLREAQAIWADEIGTFEKMLRLFYQSEAEDWRSRFDELCIAASMPAKAEEIIFGGVANLSLNSSSYSSPKVVGRGKNNNNNNSINGPLSLSPHCETQNVTAINVELKRASAHRSPQLGPRFV